MEFLLRNGTVTADTPELALNEHSAAVLGASPGSLWERQVGNVVDNTNGELTLRLSFLKSQDCKLSDGGVLGTKAITAPTTLMPVTSLIEEETTSSVEAHQWNPGSLGAVETAVLDGLRKNSAKCFTENGR